MEKVRVRIVDDSKVSCAMLEGILARTNFDVCATARNCAEAVEAFKRERPTVVTMDMNLPDADGIECSRRIHAIDPHVKIVMISAMKDAKLMLQGRAAGISSFLQKPINTNELIDTMMILCQQKVGTIAVYRESYVTPFAKAMQQSLFQLLGTQDEPQIELDETGFLEVDGIAVIIGLTGYPLGRLIFYMNKDAMKHFTRTMLNRSADAVVTDDEVCDAVEEAANIIGGRGVSKINDIFKDKEIRVTPPGTICGTQIRIANPKLTSFKVTITTPWGDIWLNVGFAGGE